MKVLRPFSEQIAGRGISRNGGVPFVIVVHVERHLRTSLQEARHGGAIPLKIVLPSGEPPEEHLGVRFGNEHIGVFRANRTQYRHAVRCHRTVKTVR